MIGQAVADGFLTGAILALGAIGVSFSLQILQVRELFTFRASDLGCLSCPDLYGLRDSRRACRTAFLRMAPAGCCGHRWPADRGAGFDRRPLVFRRLRSKAPTVSRWCSPASAWRSSCATGAAALGPGGALLHERAADRH